jgi:tetratricopeptide (TPR) repeat protein
MTDLTAFQFSPPKDWQAFERLCRSLWAELWSDQNTQLHGRTGQPQHGVDVFGKRPSSSRYCGVQCKGKDGRYGHAVTEAELREEADNARSFSPPLEEWILATTAPTDAALQRVARELSVENEAKGLFRIVVLGWDEIVARLNRHPRIAAEAGMPGAVTVVELGPESEARITSFLETQLGDIRALSAYVARLSPSQGPEPGLEGALDRQIDGFRDLIIDNEPKIALRQLTKFRDSSWGDVSDRLKFRVLSNIAACHIAMGDYKAAAPLYLQAYEFNPSADKAIANKAIAHVLLEDYAQAFRDGAKAIEHHPQSSAAWHAYLIAGSRQTPPAPIPEIPDALSDNEDVLLALHHAFRRIRRLDDAEVAIRRALKSKPRSHVLLGLFGECVLDSLSDEGHMYIGAQFSEADLARHREAIEALRRAWEIVRVTGVASSSTTLVVNASLGLFMLGDHDGALELLNDTLRSHPLDPELLLRKARLSMLRGDQRGARDAVDRLGKLSTPPPPEVRLINALILKSDGRARAAEDELQAILAAPDNMEESVIALCALGETLWQRDPSVAEKRLSEAFERSGVTDARPFLMAAVAADTAGNSEAASRYIQRARVLVDGNKSQREQLALADVLTELGQTDEAASIYATTVSFGYDTPTLRNYLRSLRRLQRRQEIADIEGKLPPELKAKRFYSQFFAAAAIESGDLGSASRYLDAYVANNPDDLFARLQWAHLKLRCGDRPEVDAWLGHIGRIQPTTVDEYVLAAQLMLSLGQIEDAAEYFYQARRLYPADERGHLGLVSVVLFQDSPVWGEVTPAEVKANTAFGLASSNGDISVHIVEPASNDPLREGEISSGSELGSRVMGATAGAPITLVETAFATETRTVVWVKSKYAHAAGESLRNFNALFPGSNALVPVHLPDSDDPEIRLDPLWKASEQKANRTEEVFGLYASQKVPIGAVAQLVGGTPMDVWRHLASDPGQAIHVCAGGAEEREAAQAALADASAGVLLDPVAPLVFDSLGVLDVLVALGKPLFVTQSTIELYENSIAERNRQKGGFLQAVVRHGQRVIRKVDASEIAQEVSDLQRLVRWLRDHCSVAPAIPKADLDAQLAEGVHQVIGDEYWDCLLAAQGGGLTLLTDDRLTREIARGIGVRGAWTQIALMAAHDRALMSSARYFEAVKRLAIWRCTFTSVSSDVLDAASAESNPTAEADFGALARHLELRSNHIPSLINVAVGYFQKQRRSRTPLHRDEGYVYALLNGISPQHASTCFLFFKGLLYACQANGLPKYFSLWISQWLQGHFLLVGFRDSTREPQEASPRK